MLAAAGVGVELRAGSVAVEGGSELGALDWHVPGDVSAAMFFAVAATMLEGSDVTIEGVGLNPTRTGALDVLREMGADVEIEPEGSSGGEPYGSLRVRHAPLRAVEVSGARIPTLIDEIPVLAIAATQAEGETVFRGAAELRVKESDRLSAMTEGLRSLGADVDELPDGLVVRGPSTLSGGRVASHGDHRVAMSFAVAGLVAESNVVVDGWSSVDTSFPGFLDVLGRAQGRLA
jgi:3-phosphoshikimate 1-carboxyvinyltransferase